MNKFSTILRVGFFLGIRQIRRASPWASVLIVSIMVLTFLNLVVISGILVGIIEGGNKANREQYTGNVIVLTPQGESYIENTGSLLKTLDTLPQVDSYTTRYMEAGTLEANYRTRRDFSELPDTAATQAMGIDPEAEDSITNLSKYVVEGEYLESDEEGFVLLGANLLRRYSAGFGDSFASLDNVYPGDKVRLTVGDKTKEFKVKGIINSKVGEVSIRAFINENEFRRFIDRDNLNVNEITIIAADNYSDKELKNAILSSGFSGKSDIRTAQEAIPQFLEDIKLTFALLGNVIGGIGLVVAAITIFIIIFINALTRRKYIGILKGIGIKASAIEVAYMAQALFYALAGSIIGILILYLVLVPLFVAHPLDFPFADGILVAPLAGTIARTIILLAFTILAGFIPARMIIKKNTLDSILGR